MESDGMPTNESLAMADVRRIETIVEFIESAVFISQGDSIYYVNAQAQALSGYSKDELLCMPFWGIFHKDFRSQAKQSGQSRHVGDSVTLSYEVKVIRKNGTVRWVNFRNSMIDLGGNPAILSVGDDITERKLAERYLQESEDKQRLIEVQKIARLGHCIYDIQADFWTCSSSLDDLFGVDKGYQKDMTGWLHIVHPDYREIISNCLQEDVLTQHQQFDMEYKIINQITGEERWVHGLGTLKFDRNNKPFEMFGAIQDITGRKKADELLNKLNQAITNAGEPILIMDKNGIIEYVNAAFTQLTGYGSDESIGQSFRILESADQDDAFYVRMWETVTSGNVWRSKVIDRRKDGSVFPAMLTIAPMMGSNGKIANFVASHADMSAFEKMETQLYQAQKIEALGTLVGGIAHDFNNMLASIDGYLYLAKDLVREMPDVVNKLSHIGQISSRAADMIKQLLTFARRDTIRRKKILLASYVKKTLEFIRTSVPENIAFHQNVCSDTLQIKGDETQIHQVLMNLISNARDALAGVVDPCITVTLDAFQADDKFIEQHPCCTSGCYAHFSVKDNGCGIPEQQIERLFDPFFTTKEIDKGTGLGLAMVYGAVKNHDGFMHVESVEGEGTTSHIYIPLLESEDIAAVSPREEIVVEGYSEWILVADDEPHIRETTAEVLESMGYNVLQAKDGLEAIEIFKAHQYEVDLAILDVVMPHLGGTQLAERLRQLNPYIPVIFVTGYDKEKVFDSSERMSNCAMLTKPVQFYDLSQNIRELLDKAPVNSMKKNDKLHLRPRNKQSYPKGAPDSCRIQGAEAGLIGKP